VRQLIISPSIILIMSKEHKELSSAYKPSTNKTVGIPVNPSELHQAFQFFDVDHKGFLTISDLKKRLGVFYQNLSLREYKFLMNNKSELTEQELFQLLQQNELSNYDPVAEAFKIYDPEDTGFLDITVFREILGNLGFNDINEQDIQTLIDTADVDGDGRVSLSDFRKMLPSHTTNNSEHYPNSANSNNHSQTKEIAAKSSSKQKK
jgi:calmodulin